MTMTMNLEYVVNTLVQDKVHATTHAAHTQRTHLSFIAATGPAAI